MSKEKLHLTTPGEILLEEFVKPLNLTQRALAQGLDIPETRVSELIHGKLRINAEYAMRLALYFRMSERFWLNLQYDYDKRILEMSKAAEIKRRVHPLKTLAHCVA